MTPLIPRSRVSLSTNTVSLARRLIGCILVRELPAATLIGRVVETEAYPAGDAASHAYRGRTPRCGSMFRPAGHAYIYVAYGVCFMLNVSAEVEGTGAAVLIRAVGPLQGLSVMKLLRPNASLREMARGPGRLTRAFDIDRSFDGIDLTKHGPLWLAAGGAPTDDVGISTRIGISKNADQLWRFFLCGSPFVSAPRRLNV